MSEFLISEDAFGGEDVIAPSNGLLWLALLLNILSAAILVASHAVPPRAAHLAGWFTSGVLTLVLVALHRQSLEVLRLRSDRIVRAPAWVAGASATLMLLGMVIAGLHSWYLATELAS